MTTAQSLSDWLLRIGVEHPRGVNRGLKHVREVAIRLDVLPPARTTITVAGTNGKGSTTAFAEQLLLAAGRSVGTTTSPHVHRFNERFRVAGEEAADAEIVAALEAVEVARGNIELSYFEYAILAALVVIKRADVEFGVLEVGLGGRLDAVNTVDADVAVITSIGLDHQEYLGDTRELIGAEKAGILRSGAPLVLAGPSPPESVLARAAMLGAPVHRAGRDFGAAGPGLWIDQQGRRELFEYGRESVIDPMNAATALQAVRLAGIVPSQSEIRDAAERVRNRGRFEVVAAYDGRWVLDVAHNPDGARFLARQLRGRFAGCSIDVIVGCLKDKDVAGIVAPLRPLAGEVAYADTRPPRGCSAASMRRTAGMPDAFAGELDDAMTHFRSRRKTNGVILVCGSFDLIERARNRLQLS